MRTEQAHVYSPPAARPGSPLPLACAAHACRAAREGAVFFRQPTTPAPLLRVASRVGEKTTILETARVSHFVARDKLTFAVVNGREHIVDYEPGESTSGLFGGNSNWRGPVWLPINFLIIEALQRYYHYYGDLVKVECPTGSGKFMNLGQVAEELSHRLTRLFIADADGRRPAHGRNPLFQTDPHWKDLPLFYEYFHGDNGSGLGASHQTGWTGLIAKLMQQNGEPDAMKTEATAKRRAKTAK